MFENLLNQAQSLLGSASPQQVADATRDHVADADPGQLADHLTQGAQGMNGSQLAALGTSLLGALSAHGHDEATAQDAGVDTNAAKSGDQQNVVALIQHAQQNPGALRDAAVSFVQQNPQVLQQLPGLLQGVLSRL
ncbi:hypothetical protein WPS_02750 [Vulcanimicrobium alpinum]|uniref:Uncharacterized protein n=1 Tax=Vulcanimicrobium alpinum TaxID=3016050 RepID=A0AAN1XSN8_UNVUL|nr:hypothetical protein [Vulcanimicrobium alpinum]BDE04999.1 hypothetical protein WPS_02750 [Vulcanimicrobium alpinum]